MSRAASIPQPAGGAAPQAVWRTLNNGMPLVLVQDMEFVPLRDGAGNILDRLIRAATFGRGIFEVSLTGTPGVRLLLRSTVIDDGREHLGAAALAFDPRLRRAAAPQQVPFEFEHGYDLRIDAPVSFDVGLTMDGAEFDEDLRSGLIRRGDLNHIYVHVQNTGHARVDDVRVKLYFAALDNAGNAPDLDADFWTNFPNIPEPPHVWQQAGEVTLSAVGPGQPRVARIIWNAPIDLPGQIALLALTDHEFDGFAAPFPTLQVDPRVHGAASLVRVERRAVMRAAAHPGRALHARYDRRYRRSRRGGLGSAQSRHRDPPGGRGRPGHRVRLADRSAASRCSGARHAEPHFRAGDEPAGGRCPGDRPAVSDRVSGVCSRY